MATTSRATSTTSSTTTPHERTSPPDQLTGKALILGEILFGRRINFFLVEMKHFFAGQTWGVDSNDHFEEGGLQPGPAWRELHLYGRLPLLLVL